MRISNIKYIKPQEQRKPLQSLTQEELEILNKNKIQYTNDTTNSFICPNCGFVNHYKLKKCLNCGFDLKNLKDNDKFIDWVLDSQEKKLGRQLTDKQTLDILNKHKILTQIAGSSKKSIKIKQKNQQLRKHSKGNRRLKKNKNY
jgi:hypothetical protein